MQQQSLTTDQAAALALDRYLQGNWAEGEAICRKILEVDPNHFEAMHLLGLIAHRVGRNDVAVQLLQRATQLNPTRADVVNNLGEVFRALNRPNEAVAAFQEALRRNSNLPQAHNNMGIIYALTGRHTEAIEQWESAIKLDPNYASAYNNLGNLYQTQARIPEAIDAHEHAVKLTPTDNWYHSNLLRDLTYSEHHTPEQLLAEHKRWWKSHGQQFAEQARAPHANNRDPDRRLKVAFLSPDFRDHSVAHFLEPIYTHRNREQFEFISYAEVPNPDETTRRLHALSDNWRSTMGHADPIIAQQIRADGIDILIDLAGHTANTRIVVCAYKPAPVQMTYLGYPFSTGLETIDYRITDGYADPVGASEMFYVEKLLRLPDTAWCYRPQPDAPAVAPPASERNGFVTFGTFNNFAKVSDGLVETWCRLLKEMPDAKLLLKSPGLKDSALGPRALERFAAHGVGQDRIIFCDYDPKVSDHLARYGDVDIALDHFPYCGTTTTCEAMWMGVPVVTLAGPIHLSRVGASLLTNVGLTELIAKDRDEYIALACGLARDPDRMGSIRAGLRDRMEQSPLCDGPRFTKAFESALREAWREWCRS
jgi:predicted O-linked N-acetylglucosamine transferase (SPINDLY family)